MKTNMNRQRLVDQLALFRRALMDAPRDEIVWWEFELGDGKFFVLSSKHAESVEVGIEEAEDAQPGPYSEHRPPG